MQARKLNNTLRMILTICGLLLLVVLFVPMWHIDLDAPQYPEGLRLLIYPNKLAGNVDIINGLNHYIGMKTMHTEDFIEFQILPYIIIAFSLAFFLVAKSRKRKLLYTLFTFFVLFGIIAMIDFWKWEYDYGHNLNPEAAIIVPGMAYQPPLIGFKQLLNFGAYSIPNIGGWLFLTVGGLIAFSVIYDYRIEKKHKINSTTAVLTIALCILSLTGCDVKQEPIKIGVDNCHFCKMTISNHRFGAEIITMKGRIYKYDELGCLLSDVKEGRIKKTDIKSIYSTDFLSNNELLLINNAFILNSDELKSPMGSNLATFSNKDSLTTYLNQMKGKQIFWDELYK